MNLIYVLIAMPLVFSVLLLIFKSEYVQSQLVRVGSLFLVTYSIIFSYLMYNKTGYYTFSSGGMLNSIAQHSLVVLELLIGIYIIWISIVNRKYILTLISCLQLLIIGYYEFSGAASHVIRSEIFLVDYISMIMILIIGVVGGLICLFAVKYMKDYHIKHPEVKDRRGFFFSLLFLFSTAMFGIVLVDNLSYLLFFWEVTTLCSFLLIGYSKTEEAVSNSFLALLTNVFGGLLFSVGLYILGAFYQVENIKMLKGVLPIGGPALAVFLICVAGLTKSAQMPFSRWLLGAMVAPTPVSAILHSSTMVKAGVYVILRLAPNLGSNIMGLAITLIGAITFLVTAIMAISQSDGKRILAYSTISNLGLIVACIGINTPESLWAAVMLIIFHAISKALLFLTVGTTEHTIGSRNVESMDGLYNVSGNLAVMFCVGIAGMFIAPFGMLISKWAAMKAFLDYNNVFVVLILAFGSTVTFFFWVKWLGKIISNAKSTDVVEDNLNGDEVYSLYSLSSMVIAACLLYPLISTYFIIPFISSTVVFPVVPPIGAFDTALTMSLMVMLFVFSIILIPFYKKGKENMGTVYMAGENTGDNASYHGSMGSTVPLELRNWYMTSLFGEKIWLSKSEFLCSTVLIIGVIITYVGG